MTAGEYARSCCTASPFRYSALEDCCAGCAGESIVPFLLERRRTDIRKLKDKIVRSKWATSGRNCSQSYINTVRRCQDKRIMTKCVTVYSRKKCPLFLLSFSCC